MLYRLLNILLIVAVWECAITDKVNNEGKHGDMIFIDDPQGDQIEGSAIDDEFADLDNSHGRGVDDEDSPGSGFGPEEDDSGSGAITLSPEIPRIASFPEGQPSAPTPTVTTLSTYKAGGKDVQPPIKMPPPDHENRVPETLDPVTPETSTKFSIGSTPPPHGHNTVDSDGHIMGQKQENRASFFAQPGILAAVIGGAVVGLLCAILLVMFIVYRMRKKDEGSYALDEPKRSPTVNSYTRSTNKEFYA
uniref:Syndecan n=1 Tax=Hadrurus spadix TaxID=141984 RepID=A0A1W7R9H6_9SCOR